MTAKPQIRGKTDISPPWEPKPFEPADLSAIHALTRGEADSTQQLRIVEWLAQATGVGEMEFRPDERAATFASGKRFVGLQFFSLAKSVLPRNT